MRWDSAGRRFVIIVAVLALCGLSAAGADAAIYWANISGNTIGEADSNGTHVNQGFIKGANGPADVLVHNGYIYWGNATGGCTEAGSCNGSIGRAKLNGSDVNENFIRTDTPYGLAIEGPYIYWSNFGSDTIGRAQLNGSHVDQDFITGASSPDGVVVNGANIYWSNSASNAIGEARLNGSHPNQSFITGADAPEGMAINRQYIYWANHNNGTIGRASLAGTNVDETFIAHAGHYPTRVAVDRNYIYWTTWSENQVPTSGTIGRATLSGTNVDDHLISSANSPVGVAITPGAIVPPIKHSVPDVVGETFAAAKRAIARAGFVLGTYRVRVSSAIRSGRVISQSPVAGRLVAVGTPVNVVVSQG